MSGVLFGTTLWNDLEPIKEKVLAIPSTLFLSGSAYQLGYQHGEQLKEAIAYNVKRLVDERLFAYPEHPHVKSFLTQLPKILKFVPLDYLQEIRGVAEGADVPYEKVLLMNLFPEMFHCSGLVVKGKATKYQKLYHVRVLDYAIGIDLQDTAVLMVVQPAGKLPFLNVSYAGFIGSVTGMNSQGIAIGEIGGKGYGSYEGMPMPFLLRTILENANNLEEVKEILALTTRTCEYYYLFSDGKNSASMGVYATGRQLEFFEPGASYALFDGMGLEKNDITALIGEKEVFNGSQVQISPSQTVIYQDEHNQQLWGLIRQQPQECLILTGFCHPERYPVLVERTLKHYGKIEVGDLQEIIKGAAGRPGNLHTAIFAPKTLDVWVAHAGAKGEPAWGEPYTHVNLNTLLQRAGVHADHH